MVSATTRRSLRGFARKLPGVAWVLEKLGIDRRWGRGKVLPESSPSTEAAKENVLLEEADWNAASLSALTNYIVTKHHQFTRQELPRLSQLHVTVCSRHGRDHPELVRIHSILQELQEGLTRHMLKEEQSLFPHIERLDEGTGHSTPWQPWGTLRNAIDSLAQDHENARQALRRLREYTSNYAIPDDASINFRALYQALEAFDKDFQQHVHLENDILFPRAVKLVTTVQRR